MSIHRQVFYLFAVLTHIAHVTPCPSIVSKSQWGGTPAALVDFDVNPPSLVFITQTNGNSCTTGTTCSQMVKSFQDYYMNNSFTDIAFNFLIGGDGAVYEGRGWGKVGAHTFRYNSKSIGIALIGEFSTTKPSMAMQNATKELLLCGVDKGQLSPAFSLYGHCQARGTKAPGIAGYNVIKTWDEWSPEWMYGAQQCKDLSGQCMDTSATCSGQYVSGKCSGPSYVKCCVPCKVELLDIQFLLDTSSSVGSKNFEKMKKLVTTSAKASQIGDDKIRFGVATYSTVPKGHVWLNSYMDEPSLLQAIDDMRYRSGYTNTHRGLDFVREKAFTQEHGDRPGVTNVVIVVTDGESSEPALAATAAEKVHDTNTIVIAVGVGDDYDEKELQIIATDNTTVFHVNDFAALSKLQEDLREKFCQASQLSPPPCPAIESRDRWEARPTTLQNLKVNPPSIVFVHHTGGSVCTYRKMCSDRVKEIQDYHINNKSLVDVGFNFLIGGDGAVYEGRGWGKEGANADNFNNRSIGIALIGDFSNAPPSTVMLNATKELIDCGVSLGKIWFDYTLYGQCQVTDTESPGEEMYNIIKTWNKWNPEWLYSTEQCKGRHGKCMDISSVCLGHYESGMCPGPSYVQCCVPCPVPNLDIQFLLDTSSSIKSENFQKMKNFLRNYAETFEIGPQHIQFGVATFSTSARGKIWLNSFLDKPSLLRAIDSIPYNSGYSYTHAGLDFVREQAFTPGHGDRLNVANVLIVVTDGESSYPSLTTAAADKLHQSNVIVLAVGVGDEYNVGELRRIATDNTTVFHVDNFADLSNLKDRLRQRLCIDAMNDVPNDDFLAEMGIRIDDVPEKDSFPSWAIITLVAGVSIVVVVAVIAVLALMHGKNYII